MGRLTVSHERLAAEFCRLLMVTNLDKMPADHVKGMSFSPRVSGGAVEQQCLPGMGRRFHDAVLRLQDVGTAEAGKRAKLAVTELARQLDGLIQVMAGAHGIAEEKP